MNETVLNQCQLTKWTDYLDIQLILTCNKYNKIQINNLKHRTKTMITSSAMNKMILFQGNGWLPFVLYRSSKQPLRFILW